MPGRARPESAEARPPDAAPWEPSDWWAAWWGCWARSAESWWLRRRGAPAVAARARERLVTMVRGAREHSALYRDLYRDVASRHVDLETLPVVTKSELMTRFDDWVTDASIRRAAVDAFLADPRHIGQKFLDRYFVWKSSGTTGVPGIFVQDAQALAIYDAMILAQVELGQWGALHPSRWLASNGRAALVIATGDHYASIASWQRARRANPALQARSFSVLSPVPTLVRELNDYQPAFLASYPTMLYALAGEQQAGRLDIQPLIVWSGGECLAPGARAFIEQAFGCRVMNEYGASECLSIGYECAAGWLHVNADWVILEPVDASYRPVRAGDVSHTVLLTNLVNAVQPIIRYDLGDSVVASPAPCRCGSPLPAIRVEGRRDEVLQLRSADGTPIDLLPMALGTVIEEATGLHRFQIARTAATHLEIRIDPVPRGAERGPLATTLRDTLGAFLSAHGLPNVTVSLSDRAPSVDPRCGKVRTTVDERREGSTDDWRGAAPDGRSSASAAIEEALPGRGGVRGRGERRASPE